LHVILPLCWIYSCLLLTNFGVLSPQSGFVVVLKQISEVSAVQENVSEFILRTRKCFRLNRWMQNWV
jgi:hypothetical protein